jgi:DNA modification methylase
MSYKLLNGDCLELMKAIPDNSIDLIFTDLPYQQTSCSWDQAIDLEKMWIEYLRVKKKNTPIFFTTTTKFGVNLINSAPKKLKFFDLVWIKSSSTGFLLSKKFPLRKHEMIYCFYEALPLYDLSSHKHKFKQEYNDYDNKDGAYGVIKSQKGHPCPLYDPPLPTSVLEIKSQRTKHSTQKPIDLMKYIFKYYSKEKDIILDNCMGSGSTGVAALQMNRDFIGIELDKDIFKVAQDRLKNKQ